MKAIPERLHIDELKRVEQQTNDLLKAWRKLNMDFARLQEDFTQLNERFQSNEQQHVEQSALQNEQSRTALENLEAKWQARYAKEKGEWEAERANLIHVHTQTLQERELAFEKTTAALKAELEQVNARKQVLINRIRGIEHE